MSLENLCQLVETIRLKSQRFGHLLSKSEAMTRYVLIDPVLRALGWDTENPELIRAEYSPGQGSADYALLENGQPMAFVEAKPLSHSLDQGVLQSINYCVQAGTPFFIITDGVRWELYQTHAPVPLLQKKIVTIDLSKGNTKEAVLNLLALWKPGFTSPGLLTAEPLPVTPVAVSNPNAGTAPTSRSANMYLSSFASAVKPNQKPPKILIDPIQVNHSLSSWKDLLVSVVTYLISQGLFTSNNCPAKLPGGSRYLIATTPTHPNGNKFFQPIQIQGLWLETHASAVQLAHEASYLAQTYGRGANFMIEV
jgi:hypothetical protein